MGGFSLHGESDAIGGVGLDLNAGYRERKNLLVIEETKKRYIAVAFWRAKHTRVGVVEVLVKELLFHGLAKIKHSRQAAGKQAHVVGRLGDVGESSRSSHGEGYNWQLRLG